MEQVSPTLHLRVRPVADLPPDGVRRAGVGETLRDNSHERQSLSVEHGLGLLARGNGGRLIGQSLAIGRKSVDVEGKRLAI